MKREMVIKALMLLAISGMIFSGCGKTEKTYVSQKKTETEISKTENDNELETEKEDTLEGKNYKITTEYDLEDYASGYVIVSKNDGLLYGVIDKDGNEVIPVEYDNIQLVRGEDEKSDRDEVYFVCEYEGEEEVLDSNGQKILDGEVERVTPHLGEISVDSPFFYELNYTYSTDYMNQDISLRYYDIKGDMLCDINLLDLEDIDRAMYDTVDLTVLNTELISNDRILVCIGGALKPKDESSGLEAYYNVSLYNLSGERLQEWNELATPSGMTVEDDNSFIFATVDYWAEGYQYELYSIDENGNLTDLGNLESQSKYSLSSAGQLQVNEESSSSENSNDYTLGKNGEYRLYQTNDTWKLEDSYGNPLYDKRYFECWHKEDCFFLLNEDNQICLINKNGQMLVDYGTITWNGEYGMFGDAEITDDSIRSDGNSVCFEVAGDGENILYIFFPEEENLE